MVAISGQDNGGESAVQETEYFFYVSVYVLVSSFQ